MLLVVAVAVVVEVVMVLQYTVSLNIYTKYINIIDISLFLLCHNYFELIILMSVEILVKSIFLSVPLPLLSAFRVFASKVPSHML